MIMECNVTLQNDRVMVVDYDGKLIQFPASSIKRDKVFVKCENGKFSIVEKPDERKFAKKTKVENSEFIPFVDGEADKA